MLMHLDHINICAPKIKLEAVKDFYCYVFELEVGFRPDLTSRGYWLYFADKALVHLVVEDRQLADKNSACLDHVAFKCRNIDAFVNRLDRKDIEYTIISDERQSQLFFYDPVNTGLEASFEKNS